MAHGFMYLVAILDVASRKVLSFRLSNTMTADYCVEALEEALAKFGRPEIFNTDQGSQFSNEEWINTLKDVGVAISMDGKGRWIDNVFIERLWRSLKYEEVYLHAYTDGTEAKAALTRYFSFYNSRRFHQASSTIHRMSHILADSRPRPPWRPEPWHRTDNPKTFCRLRRQTALLV